MNINLLRASNQLFDISDYTYLEGFNQKDKSVVLIVNPPKQFRIQTLLDHFYRDSLEPLLKHPKAKALNEWIESNGEGNWYQKLATSLGKLPIRSVRRYFSPGLTMSSVMRSMESFIPSKGCTSAAEFIIRLWML